MNPLEIITSDDPVTCAEYAKKHNLLDTPGWKSNSDGMQRSEKKLESNDKPSKTSIAIVMNHSGSLVYWYPRTHAQAVDTRP